MAEDKIKKQEDELNDEQLDEVNGGGFQDLPDSWSPPEPTRFGS